MDVFRGHRFYVSIAKFVIGHVYLPKHQKAGEVVIGPKEIVHIKDGRLSYPFGTNGLKLTAP